MRLSNNTRIILLVIFLFTCYFSEAQLEKDRQDIYSTVDKIIKYSSTNGKDTTFYKIVNTFGRKLENYRKKHGVDSVFLNNAILYAKEIRIKKPIESFRILEENIVHSSEIGDLKSLNMYYHELGKLYHDFGYIEKAAELYSKTAENFKKNADFPAYGYSLIDIGNLYFESDQYGLAKDYYDKAYKIFIKYLKGKELNYALAVYSNNMGLISLEDNNFEGAKKWFYTALEYRKKDNMRSHYSHTYLYLVRLFARNGNNDSVIYYYGKAAEMQEKEGIFDDLTNTYFEYSNFYLDIGNQDLSRIYLKKAGEIIARNNLKGFLTQYHYQHALLFHKLQQIDSALYHIIIVDSLAKQNKQKEFEELAVKAMIAIYEHLGNYKKVTELYGRYMGIRDENNNYEILKREVKVQVEEKKKAEGLTQIIERRNLTLTIVYSLLIAFSIIIIVITYTARKRISRKNKELQEALRHQNLTYSIIAHDLRGPISGVVNGLGLIKNNEVEEQSMKDDLVKISHKTLESSYMLLENLLAWSKFNEKNTTGENQRIQLSPFIENTLDLTKSLAKEKNIGIQNQVSEDFYINSNEQMLSTIIRNLCLNSIKFSKSGSEILIKSFSDGQINQISIEDQGVGMSIETIEKILTNNDLNATTHGTHNEKGTGLGLLIVKEFVKKMGGKLSIESKIGEGSRFKIELPK